MSHDREEFIQMSRFLVQSDIQELREYVGTVEALLKASSERWSAAFDRQTAGWSEEQRANHFMWNGGDYVKLSDTFPNIVRVSALLVCYSFLEGELDILSRHFECAKGRLPHQERNRQGKIRDILESEKVLTQGGIDFGLFPEWTDISTFKEIRNAIVHRRGRILTQDGNIKSFAARTATITIDHDYICPTSEFCPYVITEIEELLRRLLTELQGFTARAGSLG